MSGLLSASRCGVVSRLRWTLMPWWTFAWRYREDDSGGIPDTWWRCCIGSTALWIDKVLDCLPGSALFPPYSPRPCDCDYCRGVPGAVWEP